MSRATFSVARNRRRKRLFKNAKGFFGCRKNLIRTARETLNRAWRYSFNHRRKRYSDFRKLWILRINAACRQRDMKYSQFVYGLKKANIGLNRKILSELAIHDPAAFDHLVSQVKAQLSA